MAVFETSHSSASTEAEDHLLAPLTSGRLGAGAFYGALLGSIYALVTQVVDVLVLRDLPLQVDWSRAAVIIGVTAVSGALLGMVAAWPRETWKGALAGAVTIAVWGLVKATIELPSVALSLLFLPTFLPLVFLGLPMALVLRLTTNWHHNALAEYGLRRWRDLGLLFLAVMVVAAFAGSWAQMPPHAQEAVRQVDRILQFAAGNPDRPLSVSLRDTPEVKAHLGRPYVLNQAPINSSATGVEVNVAFDDGYTLSCLIGQAGDTPVCAAGRNVFSNPDGGG